MNDMHDMDCARWREAISAMADGEQAGLDERLLAAHVAHCPGCQSYRQAIDGSPGIAAVSQAMGSQSGIAVASSDIDLPKRVSRLAAAADRAGHWSVLRILLAVVAVQVMAFAMPALILGKEGGVATHSARHLGAFGVAYGVALLVVVARPARARSILPVALVLAGAQIIGAIVDLAMGRIPLVGEATHLPQIISVFLIWFLAVPSPRRGDAKAKAVPPPMLTVVDTDRRAG
jgi:predicted anti-sigma-YlaC factor YlaD